MDDSDPLLGVESYGSVNVNHALVWIDRTKLVSLTVLYKFIILKVDAIDGSADDGVMGNNARAQPVEISDKSFARK